MRKKASILCLACLLFSLSACGQTGGSDAAGPSQTDTGRRNYDWMTEDWRYNGDQRAGEIFYVDKYINGLEYQSGQEYDRRSDRYKCWGSDIYMLSCQWASTDSSGQPICTLNCYEDATGEIWHRRIELPDLEEYAGMERHIASFDIQNPQEYVLFVQICAKEETQAYLAMHFSPEGTFVGAADLYPAMLAEGMSLRSNMIYPNVSVDQDGRYFIISLSGEKILVLSGEGGLLTELAWDREDTVSSCAMKTEAGEPVFEQRSIKRAEMRLVMYDPATGGERVFTEQLPLSCPMAITEQGILYYGSDGQLYRWDLYTGERGVCFDYREKGLGRNEYELKIGIGTAGIPVILDPGREKPVICRLGREPGEEEDAIRLVSLVEDSSFICASAILFSQEHAEHPILTLQPEEDLTSFRSRALADLTDGRGADIYYVSGEDMRILYEKGALADLDQVLKEDTRKVLYEGALSCGVIDGRQIGLAPEAYVNTLMISDELWPGDCWTLEEVLTVMEEHPELTRLMSSRKYTSKTETLRLLLLQDLPSSPFLDMNAGTCHFDSPLFVKALEIIGETTGDTSQAAAFRVSMDDFGEFSRDMSDMGEGFHPVGFPTEEGGGSYWDADTFLVVNAQAEHREWIDAFLVSLFDQSRQRELSHPIRNDLLDASIFYVEDSADPWQYYIGSGIYYGLCTKPDGTPWTEEYKSILDRAVPRAQNTYSIEKIILEDAAAFLSGKKTADQVAETIQNRVQLYLNEQE